MKNHNIDGLEIFVKKEIDVPLTLDEEKIYNSYDDNEKKIIFDFIHDEYFKEHFSEIVNRIRNREERKKIMIK